MYLWVGSLSGVIISLLVLQTASAKVLELSDKYVHLSLIMTVLILVPNVDFLLSLSFNSNVSHLNLPTNYHSG